LSSLSNAHKKKGTAVFLLRLTKACTENTNSAPYRGTDLQRFCASKILVILVGKLKRISTTFYTYSVVNWVLFDVPSSRKKMQDKQLFIPHATQTHKIELILAYPGQVVLSHKEP